MASITGTNREYKDRLFKFIFGNPENKEWTLSLYNAVNDSHYTNADDIVFNTIEDAVYMSMKNDVSFLIENTVSFYEQQSTFNPNMPMRFLIYAGMVYSNYIDDRENHYHKFSSVQQKAPAPRCICFYNGTEEKDDRIVLSLSDSFPEDSKPDIEVKVTMININYGHNRELLDSCKPLREYAWFVDRIRTYKNSRTDLKSAINKAVKELPDDSFIKPFLMKNKSEVELMCITEYDEERTKLELKEEGRAEGEAIGLTKGRNEKEAELIAKWRMKGYTEEQIKELLN